MGVFDGVHLGHQAVIGRAVADAAPRTRRGGGRRHVRSPPAARPAARRRAAPADQHAPQVPVLRRSRRDALPRAAVRPRRSPPRRRKRSSRRWRRRRGRCARCAWGSTGRSDAAGAGNLDLLTRLGERHGFVVVGLPSVNVDGETVSSTLIRQAVEAGDLPKAARMLGREFTILGTVVAGQQLGRQLGFPTANLAAHNEQFPPDGVYAVTARWDGGTYPGVVNLGYRPTVAQPGGERLAGTAPVRLRPADLRRRRGSGVPRVPAAGAEVRQRGRTARADRPGRHCGAGHVVGRARFVLFFTVILSGASPRAQSKDLGAGYTFGLCRCASHGSVPNGFRSGVGTKATMVPRAKVLRLRSRTRSAQDDSEKKNEPRPPSRGRRDARPPTETLSQRGKRCANGFPPGSNLEKTGYFIISSSIGCIASYHSS